MPKKQCFIIVLKNGETHEGNIQYKGKNERTDLLKTEIIQKMQLNESDVDCIYLG